jgi:NTP pyrophosphatase (non-canonical NTP hydrolase)
MQEAVDQWIQTHGVRYFDELTNLGMLMEEVGEFSRLLTRNFGEQSFKPGKEPSDIKEAIADEMADIFFVLVCLANQMEIDLTDAMKQNLLKKTERDSDRHFSNENLR